MVSSLKRDQPELLILAGPEQTGEVKMAAPKNATPAQIINHLRNADVELANGKSIKEVCRGLKISEHSSGEALTGTPASP